MTVNILRFVLKTLETKLTLFKANSTKRRRKEDDLQWVCDPIISQMKDRFSYRGHLQAGHLFIHSQHHNIQRISSRRFGHSVFCILISRQTVLKTELEVIYFSQIIGTTNFHTFSRKLWKYEKYFLTAAESELCLSMLKWVIIFFV